MYRRFLSCFLYLFMILFTVFMSQLIRERSLTSVLTFHTCTSDAFRKQELFPDLCAALISASGSKRNWTDQLTDLMLDTGFQPVSSSNAAWNNKLYAEFKPGEYQFLKKCYQAIWKDPAYFPVDSDRIFFKDTWLRKSECSGTTRHQGTDLMGFSRYPGYFPVVSVSDGTVIHAGWEPQNRYQLLIEGPSGGFFYYSMLSSFEKNWRSGEPVSAGDILGYMGNPGKSLPHSFTKNFSCLHFGIYINYGQKKISVNPYWVLRAVHKKIRNYTY